MPKNKISIALLDEPDSLWAEHIYLLRAEILRQWRTGKKIFLFTSSWEGEGKSSVIVNLAASLAVAGRSVLLIDCDLRRPALSALFDLKESAGVREAVDGEGIPDTFPSPVRGLQLLPAGSMEGTAAADVLASPRLQRVLAGLGQARDVILVDSPPLSACKDALLVGKWCDGAYMVVREQRFVGTAEGHFAEDLRDEGIPLLGVVLNDSA